jgi:hypothetical protein
MIGISSDSENMKISQYVDFDIFNSWYFHRLKKSVVIFFTRRTSEAKWPQFLFLSGKSLEKLVPSQVSKNSFCQETYWQNCVLLKWTLWGPSLRSNDQKFNIVFSGSFLEKWWPWNVATWEPFLRPNGQKKMPGNFLGNCGHLEWPLWGPSLRPNGQKISFCQFFSRTFLAKLWPSEFQYFWSTNLLGNCGHLEWLLWGPSLRPNGKKIGSGNLLGNCGHWKWPLWGPSLIPNSQKISFCQESYWKNCDHCKWPHW